MNETPFTIDRDATIAELVIPPENTARIDEAFSKLREAGFVDTKKVGTSSPSIFAAHILRQHLPTNILEALDRHAKNEGPPFLHISGVPLGADAPSAKDDEAKEKFLKDANAALLTSGLLELSGCAVDRDSPNSYYYFTRSGGDQDATEQDFHDDMGNFEEPPRTVALVRVKGKKEAKTLCLTLNDIVRSIRTRPDGNDVIDTLTGKNFGTAIVGSPSWHFLVQDENGYHISDEVTERIYALHGRNEKGWAALKIFRETAKSLGSIAPYVILGESDVLITANRRAVHKGTAYQRAQDPAEERTLLASYAHHAGHSAGAEDAEGLEGAVSALSSKQAAETMRRLKSKHPKQER